MLWLLLIILNLIGILLLALEIVVLPGFIAGVLGLGLITVSVQQTFEHMGSTAGILMLLGAAVLLVLLLIFLMKRKTWAALSLKEQVNGRTNEIDTQKIHVGDTGRTLTRCAPTGKALIHDQTVEVHALYALIEADTPIVVTDISGYKISVQEHHP